MTLMTLETTVRTEKGRKTRALRAAGRIPAVLYGFGVSPTNLSLDAHAFAKAHRAAGESTVLTLDVDGAAHPVLIAEVQRNPLHDVVMHVDFRRIDLSAKIAAKIPLRLIGISPAVKDLGGTLVQSLEELEVECLPDALVHDISVDVSVLRTFEDVIRVLDIVIPSGMMVKMASDIAVVTVQPPRSEAEIAALNAAVDVDVSKVEVLKEKKEEPEAGEAEKET